MKYDLVPGIRCINFTLPTFEHRALEIVPEAVRILDGRIPPSRCDGTVMQGEASLEGSAQKRTILLHLTR